MRAAELFVAAVPQTDRAQLLRFVTQLQCGVALGCTSDGRSGVALGVCVNVSTDQCAHLHFLLRETTQQCILKKPPAATQLLQVQVWATPRICMSGTACKAAGTRTAPRAAAARVACIARMHLHWRPPGVAAQRHRRVADLALARTMLMHLHGSPIYSNYYNVSSLFCNTLQR